MTLSQYIPVLIASAILLVPIILWRLIKQFKMRALRAIGIVLAAAIGTGALIDGQYFTAVIFLGGACAYLVWKTRDRRGEPRTTPSQFSPLKRGRQPATISVAPELPPSDVPQLEPHHIRAIDAAGAFEKIADACGLAVRDAASTDTYQQLRQASDDDSDGLIARIGSLSASMQLGALKKEAGVITRNTGVYRVPVVIDVRAAEHVTTLTLAIPHGMHLADVDAALPALTQAYRAYSCQVTQTEADKAQGSVTLHILHTDPLRTLAPLRTLPTWNGDWTALPVGVRASGQVANLRLENTSGVVVGGLPGSGKTASLMGAIALLAQHPATQFHVFDGKGGHDWSWLEPRAATFSRDDEDRIFILERMNELCDLMRHRLDTMPEKRDGEFTLWKRGPSPDMPLQVVIIDECQTWLDKGEIARGDKEAATQRDALEAAIARLVRKGRSAGVIVFVLTQKPTSDSLPTTIGANASVHVAFRVKTSPAEVAIMGDAPGDGEPSARDLPAEPGYAVLDTETGVRDVMRCYYTPDDLLRQIGADTAHLRHETTLTTSRND